MLDDRTVKVFSRQNISYFCLLELSWLSKLAISLIIIFLLVLTSYFFFFSSVFGEWASVAVVQRSALREHINPSLSLKLLFGVGETVNALLSGDAVYTNLDVLLVLDGGCSPGYNAVTAYLTEGMFRQKGKKQFLTNNQSRV